MRALVAPDKFRGTLDASEVAEAICRGLRADADPCPVADGGEGTAEAILRARGGQWVEARAVDPLGRPVRARYAMLADGAAVVEMAAASGLWRVAAEERDALAATTRGTGELIADAITRGAREVLVGCGGSATTDGGAGALEAFDPVGAQIVALCDTAEPFERSPEVFAPQKGASSEDVRALWERLDAMAERLPRDPRGVEMTGAAGGLAGGLWAHGAELVLGAAFVLEEVRFDERLRSADLVVTGEGRLDRTSLAGKAVAEVARRARRAGIPCHAIVGEDALPGPWRSELGLASLREAGTADAIASAAAAIPAGGAGKGRGA